MSVVQRFLSIYLRFTTAFGLVNSPVSCVPLSSTFETMSDTTGCTAGFVRKFSFTARLTDKSMSPPLSDLLVQVKRLTNGNVLQNADGGPSGVGATLIVPETGQFADRLLSANEFVDVPFLIYLKTAARFGFIVDVLGIVHERMI